MLTVNAYAALSATEPLVPTTIQRRDLGEKDVLIEIKYAGVCHSDIHTVRGDWGKIVYPQVVGHEIVGLVTEVGSGVTLHQVGDRVGVGCMVDSCRECANCTAGVEQYCLKGNTQTYTSTDRDGTITQGGYSTHIAQGIHHTVVGDLALSFEVLTLPADPDLSLVVHTAEVGSPAADGLRLLASWAATEEAGRLLGADVPVGPDSPPSSAAPPAAERPAAP